MLDRASAPDGSRVSASEAPSQYMLPDWARRSLQRVRRWPCRSIALLEELSAPTFPVVQASRLTDSIISDACHSQQQA